MVFAVAAARPGCISMLSNYGGSVRHPTRQSWQIAHFVSGTALYSMRFQQARLSGLAPAASTPAGKESEGVELSVPVAEDAISMQEHDPSSIIPSETRFGETAEVRFVAVAAPTQSAPSPQGTAGLLGNQTLVLGALVLQAIALVGATVTGTLARSRRQEVERINETLRLINMKLRDPVEKSIPSEDEMIEIHNYRMSIEKSFGERSTSVHRSMDETLRLEECERLRDEISLGRKLKEDGRHQEALEALQSALILSGQIKQLSATRAILRIKAATLREIDEPQKALDCLLKVLAVSMAKEETAGDADVFGEIADLYAELGDLEQSGEYYDRYLKAIETGLPSNLSSTWDMA